MTNRLYYGDNLDVLRDSQAFPDASVDLICLDPPFNSNAGYNVLFKAASGWRDVERAWRSLTSQQIGIE